MFHGEDAIGWLQQCEKFFEMTGTPMEQWVNLASGHLLGRAGKWFRNLGIPWYYLSWPQFYLMVSDRFTEANAHEAVEQLQNVRQTGTVMQYIDKFEDSVSLVKRDHPYLTEAYILSCFIGGLRADIKHDVCGQKPQNLLAGYWYAKVYEKASIAKRGNQQTGFSRNRPQFQSGGNSGNRNISQRDTSNAGGQKSGIAGGEREKKTCWYCKEPWSYQHKCKTGKVIHIMEEVDEEEEETPENIEENAEGGYQTAPGSPEKNGEEGQLMQISTHAVQGTCGANTFSLITQVNGRRAVALVDSGSTNTFMNYDYAVRSNCAIEEAKERKIMVAGGGMLVSNVKTGQIAYKVQGLEFNTAFRLIPLKGFDIVLGADWIYEHSPISLDLKQRTLTVTYRGQPVKFQDHTVPRGKLLAKSTKVAKMLEKNAIGFVVEINMLGGKEQTEPVVPDAIEELL